MTHSNEFPKVPLLDLEPIHKPILERLRNAVFEVLESNHFIGGPQVEKFERAVAEYLWGQSCGGRIIRD